MKYSFKKYLTLPVLATLLLFIVPELAIAQSGTGLAGLATGLRSQVTSVANVLVIVSYVAGIGFALAGIIQFKAHKDNPAQVPLSKPIVFLIVAACLLFLPNILTTAGSSIFGSGTTSAQSFTVQ